jgi:hypothetical protein
LRYTVANVNEVYGLVLEKNAGTANIRELRAWGGLAAGMAGARSGGPLGGLVAGLIGYHAGPKLSENTLHHLEKHDLKALYYPVVGAILGTGGTVIGQKVHSLYEKYKPKKFK